MVYNSLWFDPNISRHHTIQNSWYSLYPICISLYISAPYQPNLPICLAYVVECFDYRSYWLVLKHLPLGLCFSLEVFLCHTQFEKRKRFAWYFLYVVHAGERGITEQKAHYYLVGFRQQGQELNSLVRIVASIITPFKAWLCSSNRIFFTVAHIEILFGGV